jgi:hypothetical protein
MTNSAYQVICSRDRTLCDMFVTAIQRPSVDPQFIWKYDASADTDSYISETVCAPVTGACDTDPFLLCSLLDASQPLINVGTYSSMGPQQLAQQCSRLGCHAFTSATHNSSGSLFRFLNSSLEHDIASTFIRLSNVAMSAN